MKAPEYILIMKVGPFCGFSLEEIIDIKIREEEATGSFFLGYGGVFCHPRRVKEFLDQAKQAKKKVQVLFVTTPSNFISPIQKLSHYSHDNKLWKPLPKEVLLVGSKFSIVGKNLKKADFEINLSHYQSMLGTAPGKHLDEYLRWRCDKACAIYNPHKEATSKLVKISYTCELADEGCVYVK